MIKPYLIDTTLRDGEQTPGVVFSLDEKIQICSLLDKIGIPEIEIGMPIVSANDADDIKSIVNSGFNFKTLAWCRAKFEDMKAAQKTGVDGAHLSFPVSDIQLNAIGKDKAWVLNQMKEVLTYANDNFSFVSLGAQDAPRANREFLYDYISSAISLGIKRIRIADTTGMMNPDSVKELFLWLSSLFPMFPFEFHAHNDLGMATANTVTALTSGAQSASVTVNGLGERAGNAALEEVCMAMEISYGVKMNLNYHYINEISQYT